MAVCCLSGSYDVPIVYETEFFRKSWVLALGAALSAVLTAFGLVMGPLFYLDVIRTADGKHATDAGIYLMIVGVLGLIYCAATVRRLIIGHVALLRIFREGIELNHICAYVPRWVCDLPGLLRAIWILPINFLVPCRARQCIRWEHLVGVSVVGLPMMRKLVVSVAIAPQVRGEATSASQDAYHLALPDTMFSAPLERIVQAIGLFSEDAAARTSLRNWDGV